jgi:phosphohistidine phosphatase SixA
VSTVLLVRHASAGDRSDWEGEDRERPLDERGSRQADGLVELLGERRPTRVFSSGYLRCRETVQPLADALGLPVEEAPQLEEGASKDNVHDLVERLQNELPALCTHGDVVEALVGEEGEKGATWVLELERGEVRLLEYLPPPA